MTSLNNQLRRTLLTLGLVLGVLGLSLAGWRAGAREQSLRLTERMSQSATPAPVGQPVRSSQKAEVSRWMKLRSALGSFGLAPQAITAVDDNATATENTPTTISVLANDTGVPAGAALTIISQPGGGTGTVALGASNTVVYTPPAGFLGNTSFKYGIIANPAPTTANNDAAVTLLNTPVTVAILANDFDPQNDPLTVTIQTPPAQGMAVVNPDKTITYTPPNGFTGLATFVYKIDDGNGNMATATVQIDVRLSLSASTLHYLPPQYSNGQHGSQASQIFIETDDPNGASGTISVPNGGTSVSFSITPTTSFTYALTDETFGRTMNANQIASKGLIVSSNNPVNVQMVQENSIGQSYLVSKGLVALGKDFYAGQMGPSIGSSVGNYDGGSFISVMATENNTSVTFTRPPSAAWNWIGASPAAGTFTITLQAGQSYVALASNPSNASPDMTGSRVQSNRPIAVSSGSMGILFVNGGAARDNGWDQLVPVEKVGTKYVIFGSNSSPDVTDFVATQNGTQISVDGALVATINAGQYYRLDLTSSTATNPPEVKTVTASAPVYAYQNAGLVMNRGENGLALVAPINTSSRGVWRFRSPNPTGRAFFLTTTSAAASLTLTNVTGGGSTNVSLGSAIQVPGDASLSYFIVSDLADSAEFKAQASAFVQITMFTGGGAGGGMGYFGGFTSSDVAASDDNITVPTNTPITFDPRVNDTDGANDPLTISNVSAPGQGTVTNNGNGTLTYTPPNGFTGSTSFSYTVTDGNGNFSTATISVTVTPLPIATVYVTVNPASQPPAITSCPMNQSVNVGAGQCMASVSFNVTALGTPAPTITCKIGATTITSPHNFPVGTSNVICTASNGTAPDATCSFSVTVTDNQPPTITAPANVTANANAGACAATGVDLGAPITNDNCAVAITNNAPSSFPVGVTTVTWTVTDLGGNQATALQTVTVVDNQKPTISAPAAVNASTSAGATACGVVVSDAALGVASASDNCGTANITRSGVPAGNLFPVGTTTITYTANDGHGNTQTATQTVTVVDNTAPVIACPASLSVVGNIPGSCGANVSVGVATATDNCGAPSVTGTRSDGLALNAPYPLGTTTITWTATDVAGNQSTCPQTVTVTNPAPVATITGPMTGSVYSIGTLVNFTGSFSDNAGGTHTATWKFDALTQAGTVNEATGAITGSFTFTAAGVFKVTLTVTDGCGGSHTTDLVGPDGLTELVVIYDASAGWVTGGGWINSPTGAYVPNPTLVGKANFGFVSKYQNGNSVPTGNTEFQFKAGNLNFSSTVYEWMVIAGARAQYKGSGKINGAGDYRFMLTAIDGQEPGGGGADKFRIRIWNNAGGGLVYDNQLNAPDNNDPTTVLGGGSIVIHK